MEDVYDTCPFDKSHRILRARMPTHLTKCEKRHMKVNKKRCPFDARHIVDDSEWQHHINTCPGRESVIHHTILSEDPVQSQLLPIVSQPVMQCENWDEEIEVKSYNPAKMSEDKPVLRIMVGGSKKERKLFREQERLRRAQLENDMERKAKREQEAARKEKPKKQSKAVDPITSPEPADQYKPLRRPRNPPPQVDANASYVTANNLTADLLNNTVQNASVHESTDPCNAWSDPPLQQTKASSYASVHNNTASSNSWFDYPLQQEKASPHASVHDNTASSNSWFDYPQQAKASSREKDEKLSFAAAAGFSKNKTDESSGKENVNINTSAANDKLSKTLEELEIGEKEHKKEQESLDKKLFELNFPLMQTQENQNMSNGWTKVGIKHKKSKNAANFSSNF